MAHPDFGRKEQLSGNLVTLRPVSSADVPTLYDAVRDPETLRLTGTVSSRHEGPRWTLDELRSIYRGWMTATDRIVWAVVEHAGQRVIGECVLLDLDARNLSCGLRIWLGRHRGGGLGTEAVRLAVRHAFADHGLHRVELEVYAFNPRARHVYEKVGFRREGVRRHALRFEDQWIDAELMGLLAEEWAQADQPVTVPAT